METVRTIMLVVKDLPEEVRWHILRYLRHPLAEISSPWLETTKPSRITSGSSSGKAV